MVRSFRCADDLEAVMQIWLHGNLEAHPFIDRDYWFSNFSAVKEQLPAADILVAEAEGRIQGFLGLAGSHIAGIFVEKQYRSMGVGSALLRCAKAQRGVLSLCVYQKNARAVAFYRREGFSIVSERLDPGTGEPEYLMAWPAPPPQQPLQETYPRP